MQNKTDSTSSVPPRADKRPHRFTLHGTEIVDDYAWL
jgi:protease II